MYSFFIKISQSNHSCSNSLYAAHTFYHTLFGGVWMKVYVHDNGIILVGKGWEIIQKLKEYNKDYSTVAEWLEKVAPK
jgi:hypothetical protein